MKSLYFLLFSILFMFGCEENHPPEFFLEEEKIEPEVTFSGFTYKLDPYHEFLSEIPEMLVYVQGESLMVESKTKIGELGALPYAFNIVSIDTIFFANEGKLDGINRKIRYTVQDIEQVPDFMQKQYLFEVYDGFLIVDGKHIYCTNKTANTAIEYLDKGLIGERNPYLYTMQRMETLSAVAKKFKTNEELLLKWNPHLKYGYTVGSQVRIHWVPTELQY